MRNNPKSRQVIKLSRWLLLHNPENLPEGNEVRLSEFPEANQPLNTVCVMKSALKELWYAPNELGAGQRRAEWYRQAQENGIKVLRQFAEKLREYVSGITASTRHRLNTSIPEGMNSKLRVIKRMTCGSRDNDDVFLKIKAAFPDKAQ
ncbi:ISL3 family transposase [Enterobacter mori]|uniref:ISL3 family transposase n=1 Tax=Enterobacter mori TaxID=539813 RepID=UPI003B841811